MKILLVDDEVDFAEALAERLKIRGYEMSLAHSGKEVLTKVAQQAPDVILLDINMPDMTGFEVLEKLSATIPATTIFMLTGHSYASHKDEAIEKGAKDCLTKPVDIKELQEKLASINN